MSPELDNKLCKEFPLLYADRRASMQETCMCWGFDVGDGWYKLIYELSSKLEPLLRQLNDPLIKASQVKEKFATLRFYMTTQTDEMDDLINEAEDKSAVTCETCGEKGSLRNKGWYSTRCDKCYEKERVNRS